jgi:hypothetical protein
MLVAEVYKLNRIIYLFMTLDATYCDVPTDLWIGTNILKSRTSIRLGQPETLDSIKYHTFPGFKGKTLDILWHDSTLQFFFVPNVLIEIPAHINSFIVIPAQLLHARARQSDLHTSKSI